ncbi:MAG: tetratricopeptide repeat protein [Spirulinaceae cyanobacterium]
MKDIAQEENERSLKTLARTMKLAQGRFSLHFVWCNYTHVRTHFLKKLEKEYEVGFDKLFLPQLTQTIREMVAYDYQDKEPESLMILGLEEVKDLDKLLVTVNRARDKVKANFPFPLVVWVTDKVLKKLCRLAPDLSSWGGAPIHFLMPDEELRAFVEKQVERAFSADSSFGLDDYELQAVQQDLAQRPGVLSPKQEAGWEFILASLAINNNQIEQAIAHYKKSLTFWQESNNLERQGTVLLNIAFVFYSEGEKQQEKRRHYWQQASDCLQQCLAIFEQAQLPSLVAEHISQLGEVLRRLKAWEQLQNLAQKALTLHQDYGEPEQIAQDYGFLAEVALEQFHWQEANQLAKQALEIFDQIPQSQPQAEGLYHFLLARRLGQTVPQLQRLEKMTTAIAHLEIAGDQCSPSYDPQLYISILDELGTLYFEQGKYLRAFKIKQARREIQTQYGLRAFIGAGKLQPHRQMVASKVLSGQQDQDNTFEDIVAVSGRQQDVNRLLERITLPARKLTVIYGQSGVGKSSIVEAGLLPALKLSNPEGREAVPILLRVYSDWLGIIDNALKDIAFKPGSPQHLILGQSKPSIQQIIDRLQENAQSNLLTVLILDQFEEFFFVHKERQSRKLFYEFFRQCLAIPYVKVIISIREDYLHYLLECSRTTKLNIIDNNILDKDILYYLGNFTAQDAKSVIQSLTDRAQFHLESELIEQLVRDLAGDLGEVLPIELQIVGAQLQREDITSLTEYKVCGPKEKLVEHYLATVVEDCGQENEQAAQRVLYYLTDENNTRPFQTKEELASDTESPNEQLNLVLTILVGSGLIARYPGSQLEYYQLVHDYLVNLIRQKYQPISLELELTKQQLKQSLAQEKKQRQRAEVAEIKALNSLAKTLLLSHDQLGALVASVKAGKKLLHAQVTQKLKIETMDRLRQTIQGVKERNRLQGHDAAVFSVTISSDGEKIATASWDKTVIIWSRQGEKLNTIRGHEAVIYRVTFAPDSQTIATSSGDKTIRLWNLEGEQLKVFSGHEDEVYRVSFSPDGKLLASASRDKTIKLWSINGEQEIKTLQGHEGAVYRVSFSPDGKLLVSASEDGTVKIWNLAGELLRTILAHDSPIYKVAFSPVGGLLATASDDKTAKLWSLEGEEIVTLSHHTEAVYSITFSPDGSTIATGSGDKTVKLWNLKGEEQQTLSGHENAVYSLSVSLDGKTLATGSGDKTVKLWSLEEEAKQTLRGHNNYVTCVRFSPDGQTLATGCGDKIAKLWNLEGEVLQNLQGHEDAVNGLSFSPDGQKIVTASLDHTARIWNLQGQEILTLQGHQDKVYCANFSIDGQKIATASFDRTARIWNLQGQEVLTLQGHQGAVFDVNFSPLNNLIVTASDDSTVKLWNLKGEELKTLIRHDHGILRVVFSPDGKMIATASLDGTAKLWNLQGEEIKTLASHNNSVLAVRFSPDGKTIATASADGTLKLWNLAGEELQTFRGHKDAVTSISFSPDGKTIATASGDRTVMLWNFELDYLEDLLMRGGHWLRDYLLNNPYVDQSDRYLCEKRHDF